MSKSRRIERIRGRSERYLYDWGDSNTPMDKFEGSQAQKDLKKHFKLEGKAEKIEGKVQAKETKREERYQKKEAKKDAKFDKEYNKAFGSSETKEKPKPSATSKPSESRKVETRKAEPTSTKMVGSNKGTAVTSAFAKIEEAAKKRREASAEDKARRQELRAKRDAKSAKAGSWVQGIVGLQGFGGSKRS